MTTINDIYSFLCELAPTETAMDFDNCGLLVESGEPEVSKALLALDITAETAEIANKIGAQLIISHHPVIFNPLKRIEHGTAPYILVKNGISAICMHTNLDRAPICGVNVCLANALGLENIELDSENCIAYGDITAQSPAEFAMRVKTSLGCAGLRYTDNGKILRRAAVSSGAGGGNVFLIGNKADVFVVGEIKHHELLFAAENGISIIDAGHRKTEEIVLPSLCKHLEKRFPNVDFIIDSGLNDRVEYI